MWKSNFLWFKFLCKTHKLCMLLELVHEAKYHTGQPDVLLFWLPIKIVTQNCSASLPYGHIIISFSTGEALLKFRGYYSISFISLANLLYYYGLYLIRDLLYQFTILKDSLDYVQSWAASEILRLLNIVLHDTFLILRFPSHQSKVFSHLLPFKGILKTHNVSCSLKPEFFFFFYINWENV